MYTVYIIHSGVLDRYYVGMTRNMRVRLKQHRRGQTRSLPPGEDWAVIWSTNVDSGDEARALEKRIKARGAGRFLRDRAP
jgi:putative endonuclease